MPAARGRAYNFYLHEIQRFSAILRCSMTAQPTSTPVYTWRLTAAGLDPLLFQPAPTSLDAVSMLLPQGVYTTFRTYAGCRRVIGLPDHLGRLEESARGAARAYTGVSPQEVALDQPRIRQALRQALQQRTGAAAGCEARVRLSLDLSRHPNTLYLSVEELRPQPAAVYTRGVRLASSGLRRRNPRLKETHFLKENQSLRRSLPLGIFELLLFDDQDRVLEGMTSNFFGVRRGEVLTAGEGVLPGVTRRIVLELIRQAGIPLQLTALPRGALAELDEAFITSSSRGVVPVVQVDRQVIGNGAPGPLTHRLGQDYESWVLERAEVI
jgi:branched-chain amino acid aminotransferase